MTSASDVQLLMRVILMTSASEPLVFRTSFLQNAFLQHKLPFCRFHCSHLFFSTYAFKDTKFLSMVLYTWTNISISNWQFLIPCYHQNSKGNVKHILFQHYIRSWVHVYINFLPYVCISYNYKGLPMLKHNYKRLLFKQNYKEIFLRLNT